MDGQEYLNQISRQNRPAKKSLGGIFSSKIFIFGAIGVVALLLIIIIGSMLSGGKEDAKTLSFKLKLHLDNTSEVIRIYQPKVKSSNLRSSSASLQSILSSTTGRLTSYIEGKYGTKDKDFSEKIRQEAELNRDDLESELFEAKINGILDRIYAHKMTYEVSSIMSEEEKLINSSKDDELIDLLTSSYNSLENLYTNFSDFSETN